MKRIIVIATLVFIIGISTSIFRHKIIASGPVLIDQGKILINITNDAKKAVRVYVNNVPSQSTLVNPGRIFTQQIHANDIINLYSPEQNTTFRITLTNEGKNSIA